MPMPKSASTSVEVAAVTNIRERRADQVEGFDDLDPQAHSTAVAAGIPEMPGEEPVGLPVS